MTAAVTTWPGADRAALRAERSAASPAISPPPSRPSRACSWGRVDSYSRGIAVRRAKGLPEVYLKLVSTEECLNVERTGGSGLSWSARPQTEGKPEVQAGAPATGGAHARPAGAMWAAAPPRGPRAGRAPDSPASTPHRPRCGPSAGKLAPTPRIRSFISGASLRPGHTKRVRSGWTPALRTERPKPWGPQQTGRPSGAESGSKPFGLVPTRTPATDGAGEARPSTAAGKGGAGVHPLPHGEATPTSERGNTPASGWVGRGPRARPSRRSSSRLSVHPLVCAARGRRRCGAGRGGRGSFSGSPGCPLLPPGSEFPRALRLGPWGGDREVPGPRCPARSPLGRPPELAVSLRNSPHSLRFLLPRVGGQGAQSDSG